MIVIPCPEQIRMARAGLGWSQHVLAMKSGLSVETIKRIESDKNTTQITLQLIALAFLEAGATFEPYDHKEFNDSGPIVRMRVRADGSKWYGTKGL